MADNYLENKMEEYRSTNSSKKAMHRPVYGVRPDTVVLPYPMKKVVIMGADTPQGEIAVRTFRKADCRVAFCGNDMRHGARLAQNSGGQFYPIHEEDELKSVLERIRANIGEEDVIVVCNAAYVEALQDIICRNIIVVSHDENSVSADALISAKTHINNVIVSGEKWATALSNLCLLLTMPGSEVINGQCIHIG